MHLLTTILGQFMGVGVIALIIVFQQEIRRFFLHIGTNYFSKNSKFIIDYLQTDKQNTIVNYNEIIKACDTFSKSKTGALIVLSSKSDLSSFTETGDYINANINSNLIKTIFFKNSPQHDGAMIIVRNRILAVRCTLPIDKDVKLASNYGLRHISAMSMNYQTNALIITVSEETGKISYIWNGELNTINSDSEFKTIFKLDF